MSNFACPKCGKVNVDSEKGYVQGCDCDLNTRLVPTTFDEVLISAANSMTVSFPELRYRPTKLWRVRYWLRQLRRKVGRWIAGYDLDEYE